jgi:hypothetical protein
MKTNLRPKVVIFTAIVGLFSDYVIAYSLIVERDVASWRYEKGSSETFRVHTRTFPYSWMGSIFYPAAYVERKIVDINPAFFTPDANMDSKQQTMVIRSLDSDGYYRAVGSFPKKRS